MNYSDLVQLYFDRSTAMQNYWNLYVLVVGGLLAFSSCANNTQRSPPRWSRYSSRFLPTRTRAMKDVTAQRFALLDSIGRRRPAAVARAIPRDARTLEPTLTPATYASVKLTHITSDVLTILALVAMELRRRSLREVLHAA